MILETFNTDCGFSTVFCFWVRS